MTRSIEGYGSPSRVERLRMTSSTTVAGDDGKVAATLGARQSRPNETRVVGLPRESTFIVGRFVKPLCLLRQSSVPRAVSSWTVT